MDRVVPVCAEQEKERPWLCLGDNWDDFWAEFLSFETAADLSLSFLDL